MSPSAHAISLCVACGPPQDAHEPMHSNYTVSGLHHRCAAADCASARRISTSYSENFGAGRHCTDRPLTGYDTLSDLRLVAGAMPKVLRMLGQRRGCAIALVARLTQAITL
ncbi:hypothetical protein CERSUDRAFT_120359 [Gelatoporia subvermispora B]|uniref:Uncharacterized protein n=1 Tax=Ceriporiopsis subvermispora (strain B) TaxID=914234 RepID=M2QVU7_CERS8|nr:hypothetical protein CERSUDRAFT_120359 [Gelatoporia subvermispora B]